MNMMISMMMAMIIAMVMMMMMIVAMVMMMIHACSVLCIGSAIRVCSSSVPASIEADQACDHLWRHQLHLDERVLR